MSATPTTTWSVWLPLPTKPLSPNSHVNWRKKAEAKRQYKEVCVTAYKAAKLPRFCGPVILHLEFFLCRQPVYAYRCKNIACKPRRRHSSPGHCKKCGCDLLPINIDPSYRPTDQDNARSSFKVGQDGLKEAGMIVNDTHRWVKLGRTVLYTRKKEHQGKTGVLLTIELCS